MRTIRCRRCRQMFAYEGLPPPCCPDCAVKQNERLALVRALVMEFPGITAMEVQKHTGVPINEIMEYLKNGDLEVATPLSHLAEEKLNEYRNYIGKAEVDEARTHKKEHEKYDIRHKKHTIDSYQIGKKR